MVQSLSSSFDRQSFSNGISLIIIIAFVLSITPSNVKCSGREYKFCAQTYLHGLITLDNAIYLQFANGIWRYFDGEQRLPTYDKTLRQLFYLSNPFSEYDSYLTGFIVPDNGFEGIEPNTGFLFARDNDFHIQIERKLDNNDSDTRYGATHYRIMEPNIKNGQLEWFVDTLKQCTNRAMIYLPLEKKLIVSYTNPNHKYQIDIYNERFDSVQRDVEYPPSFGTIHGYFQYNDSSTIKYYFYTDNHFGLFDVHKMRFASLQIKPKHHKKYSLELRSLILLLERFGCKETSTRTTPDEEYEQAILNNVLIVLNIPFAMINITLILLSLSFCMYRKRRLEERMEREHIKSRVYPMNNQTPF